MASQLVVASDRNRAINAQDTRQFVTMFIDEQLFGVPTQQIQDAHVLSEITPVPLAPREIAGVLNIRGKIVTAINLRIRLGLDPRTDGKGGMSILVEHEHDLYSLMIDSVRDVVDLPNSLQEQVPINLDRRWRDVAESVYRLDGELMIESSVPRLLNFLR